jgi:hypothetical protein
MVAPAGQTAIRETIFRGYRAIGAFAAVNGAASQARWTRVRGPEFLKKLRKIKT